MQPARLSGGSKSASSHPSADRCLPGPALKSALRGLGSPKAYQNPNPASRAASERHGSASEPLAPLFLHIRGERYAAGRRAGKAAQAPPLRYTALLAAIRSPKSARIDPHAPALHAGIRHKSAQRHPHPAAEPVRFSVERARRAPPAPTDKNYRRAIRPKQYRHGRAALSYISCAKNRDPSQSAFSARAALRAV